MLLKIDGVSLQNFAFNVTSRGSRWSIPDKTAANVPVPGRSGTIWTPGKLFDQNTLTLGMWVIGANTDGSFPTDRTRAQKLKENVDRLTRLFTKTHALIEVIQDDDANTSRRCYAEVVASFDFTSAPGNRAEFAVQLVVPAAFWEDVSLNTFVSASGLTTGTNVAITSLSGGTAVIEDAVITFRGAGTNPKITDILSGAWVQLQGTVASGQDWVVDSSLWTSTNNAVNVVGTTVHSGAARLLPLQPNPDTGDVILKVEGASFNANTRLTVAGRRKWFIA